jgi:hypothetical protein
MRTFSRFLLAGVVFFAITLVQGCGSEEPKEVERGGGKSVDSVHNLKPTLTDLPQAQPKGKKASKPGA